MKNIPYLFLATSLLFFAGCRPEKKTPVVNAPSSGVVTNQAPVNDGSQVQLASPQSQAGTPVNPVGLNPAHGLPGHRCDIPVGASLNSPPQSNPTMAPRLPAPTLPLPSAPGLVAGGTNPPHGQPGHDCSKPVGAPLGR